MQTPTARPPRTGAIKDRTQRIPALDGWRGIAILMVLLSHAAICLRLGRLGTQRFAVGLGQHGVALFFVLSGYLITSLLLRESDENGSIDLKGFYIRRAFRILPCAWAFLFFLLIVTSASHPKPFTGSDIFGSLFFFRNFINSAGVEATTTGHFWSLSIEEQFYLLWPAILVLGGRKNARWISLAAAAGIGTYRAAMWVHLSTIPLGATFGTQYRADFLLVGCAAALWAPSIVRHLREWMVIPLLAVLFLCVARYQGLIPLRESVVIAALLLITANFPLSRTPRILECAALRTLGKYSYSLYVWQQLMFFNDHAIVISMMAVPAIALFSYTFIETPLRQRGVCLAARRKQGRSAMIPAAIGAQEARPRPVAQ